MNGSRGNGIGLYADCRYMRPKLHRDDVAVLGWHLSVVMIEGLRSVRMLGEIVRLAYIAVDDAEGANVSKSLRQKGQYS